MAQYKVLKEFRLLDDPKVPKVGQIQEAESVIELTVRRAGEVEKKLGSSFLERVDKAEGDK